MAIQVGSAWEDAPALPAPVTNNATAAAPTPAGTAVFSFLGLDSTKRWSGVTNRSYSWVIGEPAWTEIAPVPGPGRLAPTAQTVGGLIYVFGGYTVAEDGAERSVPNVDVYDPATGAWSRAADMPVPVDDAVSGVWRDSLIYLVSGWHDRDNVSNVQVFDPAADEWRQASPIPGTPVFGHTGAIAGDQIVYVDGTARNRGRPRYTITAESWRGRIDPANPTDIAWDRLPQHPGPPRYRAAATGLGPLVLFVGGSSNPYNYTGVGYDGNPSQPLGEVIAYDTRSGEWREMGAFPNPTMDHRNIPVAGDRLVVIGGMESGQVVTTRVRTVDASRYRSR